MTSPGTKFDMLAAYRAQTAEIARLRGLLKELEWAGDYSQGAAPAVCPACDGYRPTGDRQPEGHESDCWLDAELHRQQPAGRERV